MVFLQNIFPVMFLCLCPIKRILPHSTCSWKTPQISELYNWIGQLKVDIVGNDKEAYERNTCYCTVSPTRYFVQTWPFMRYCYTMLLKIIFQLSTIHTMQCVVNNLIHNYAYLLQLVSDVKLYYTKSHITCDNAHKLRRWDAQIFCFKINTCKFKFLNLNIWRSN